MSRKLNVYLCGNKVGILSEDELLQLSFQYDNDKVAPLSVHLPVRNEKYTHALTFPFFENLTPEGEAFEILTKDHVSGNKTFSILDRFGGDCAGAVAFYETAPNNDRAETLPEISADKVAQIIDKLPKDPLLTSLENPPRLSLAGAQAKFAVYKFKGKYYRSDDEHPTTHIIKITNKRFPNLLKNELFCMKLAQTMQLDTPNIELKETAGRPYLEIARYDRNIEKGIVRRIHQEDFCQAMGIVSAKKYQAGGGASLRDCCGIVERFSENKLVDIKRFVEWIVFNYLIGNTDAHAKNLSLLHTKAGIRLAPFYDLLSTEIYPEKFVDHNMAMFVNGKGKYDSLKPKDFSALFEQLGLNATNMLKSLKNKFTHIISSAENLRKELLVDDIPLSAPQGRNTKMLKEANISDTALYADIIKIVKKRLTTLFGNS
jgi:serine/threonine-protein kinase HipA